MTGIAILAAKLTGTSAHRILQLVVIAITGIAMAGCSGFVAQNSTSGNLPPLSISNAAPGSVTQTGAMVTWTTNSAATSQVSYGTTSNYGSTTGLDSTLVTNHQQSLSGLKPGTGYHFKVASAEANGQSVSSSDMTFTTAADTTPPTVSLTSPAANATLSGTVSLTATATDNVGVASVQFKVDSANVGSALAAAPYTFALNTTTLSDGNHILTAVATDTSGNTATSTGVAVKVNNATPGPSIAGLSPASGLVGTSITISGANFGATQGTSTVTFNGTIAAPTNWSSTSIVAAVPAGATTGNVVVTVGGVASNGVSFAVPTPAPSITSLNPTSGLVGTSVTIAGTNFGATQGTSTVKFNGTTATPSSWSATGIVALVPAGATTGNVVVTVGGVASNGVSFTVTVPTPSIAGLNPASGAQGTPVTITGVNFGATQGTSIVTFNGILATPTSWSTTSIAVPVPAGATTGNVVVTVGGVASNGVGFTVTAPGPSITSLNPTSGLVGAAVTISGANFGAAQGTSTVTFNGTAAAPTTWSATSITVPVPTGATTGNVVVKVGSVASNGVNFTVAIPAPSLTSLNPTSGVAGTSVTVTGANFGATQGTSTVKFNGTTATPSSWSATGIVALVPAGATTGNVVVTVGGVASNGVSFTVPTPAPSITSLNPTSGLVATSVTITGTNFGATQGTSTVKFNGTTATPSSWSATGIVALVPAGATTGNVVVTVGGVASNGVSFTVQTDTIPPTISLTAPANGATVSGTVSITATASDNVGVTGVQFEIDGANAGSLETTAPYSYAWNTTTSSNGSHVLTARAQDAAGNVGTSAPVTVTVSNTSGGAGTDFATRCASPGVILCQGFTSPSIFGCNTPGCSVDTPSDWTSGIWQGLDVPGVADAAHMPIIDTTNFAPDHTTPGSLRFIQTGNVGTNNAGAWYTQFCSGNNPSQSTCYFGPGQDFYIQWRQYVNSTALNTNWTGSYSSEGWKQVIVGEGNTCPSCTPSNNYPSHVAYACSPMEFVIQNTVPGAGTPIINRPTGYHSCGDKDSNYEDVFADTSAGISGQNNWDRSNTSNGGCDYPAFSDCKFYAANTWMTFQIHIRPSTWYANNHVYHQDGIFQMWVCTTEAPGTACPLIVDTQRSDFSLHHEGGSAAPSGPGYDYINSANGVDPVAKYGKIYLLPYQTGLSGNIGSNQAIWWYDDLIISSQKIPDPKQ